MAFLFRFVSRTAVYWKTVADDYRIVVTEAIIDSSRHKVQTTVLLTGLSVLYYAYRTNPDEEHLANRLVTARLYLQLVPSSIRDERSAIRLQLRTNEHNQRLLTHWNCLLFSLLRYDHPAGEKCHLFQCQNWWLAPSMTDWWKSIVDVGAFGRWFVLDDFLIDCDINPQEWIDCDVQAN